MSVLQKDSRVLLWTRSVASRLRRRTAKLGDTTTPIWVGALVCLLPLLWFGSGTIVQGADYKDPLNAGRWIAQVMSGWNTDNLGQSTFRDAPLLFPFLGFWRLAETLGLSPSTTQRLWFIGLLALTYFSSYYFLRTVVSPYLRRGWATPVVIVAYILNPFTIIVIAVGHTVPFLAYAVAPLWLAVLYQTLTEETRVKTGLKLGLTSLLFASAINVPPIVVTMIILPSLGLALLLVVTRHVPLVQLATRAGLGLAWVSLLNAWWLIPFVQALFAGADYHYSGQSADILSWPELATPVPFTAFLRGAGFWGLYSGYVGLPYFTWASWASSAPVVLSGFWLIGVALSPLAFRRPAPWAILTGGLFLVGVFFVRSLNGPLAGINEWLYLNVPGFFLFRHAYEKFAGLIFLAILIGLALAILVRPRGQLGRSLLAAFSLLAIIVSGWQMAFGVTHASPQELGVKNVIRLPPGYDALHRWTERRVGEGSILVVPQTPTGYVKTTWGFAGGADPIYNYSSLPMLGAIPEASTSDGGPYPSLLAAAASYDNPELLRNLGVDYVLVRGDIDANYYAGTQDPGQVETRLQDAGYNLAASFGELTLYAVPGMSGQLQRNEPSASRADAGTRTDIELGSVRMIPVPTRSSQYPLTFRTRIRPSEGATWIVLRQTFHHTWHLAARSADGKSVGVVKHIPYEGFSNAWLVEGKGVLTIEVRQEGYLPIAVGLAVSSAALLAVTLMSLIPRFRRGPWTPLEALSRVRSSLRHAFESIAHRSGD